LVFSYEKTKASPVGSGQDTTGYSPGPYGVPDWLSKTVGLNLTQPHIQYTTSSPKSQAVFAFRRRWPVARLKQVPPGIHLTLVAAPFAFGKHKKTQRVFGGVTYPVEPNKDAVPTNFTTYPFE